MPDSPYQEVQWETKEGGGCVFKEVFVQRERKELREDFLVEADIVFELRGNTEILVFEIRFGGRVGVLQADKREGGYSG